MHAALYTTADFFPDVRRAASEYGNGWGAAEDDSKARVVVITLTLNDKLFGGKNSVGQIVRLQEKDFRIVGVLGDWHPNPHFYEWYMGNYAS